MRPDFQNSPLLKNEVKPFIFKIENDEYFIRGIFINPNGDKVSITKQNLRSITINDNIHEPFVNAEILMMDTDNSFERTKQGSGVNEIKGFNFRGDGKDVFFLQIIPIKDIKNKTEILTQENFEYNRVFSFQNLFAVVNEETLIVDGQTYKNIKLEDYDRKKLSERKIQYNSSYTKQSLKEGEIPIPTSFKSNSERSSYTGESIYDILTVGLKKSEKDLFNIDYDQTGIKIINNFEKGLNKIFYTSDSKKTSLDDINYLVNVHVSEGANKTFSYLKKEYFTGKYTFESIESMFKKAIVNGGAGPYGLEKLTITGESSISEDTNSKKVKVAGLAEFNNKSVIIDAKFFNPWYEMKKEVFNTKIVHNYDHENKEFNIFKRNSSMTAARTQYKSIFVDVFGENSYSSFISSPGLDTNESFEDVYSLYGDENNAFSKGQNKLLKNLLMTGLAVDITVPGQLLRKAGRFITIDRANNYTNNDFDSKFLGTYFIIKCDHLFDGDNKYANKIYAVKTYFNDNIKNVEGLN